MSETHFDGQNPAGGPTNAQKLYFTAWRWHFYAGLYVIPFLILLSVTGMLMIWFTAIAPEYGDRLHVTAGTTSLTISQQMDAALQAHPTGTVDKLITPLDNSSPVLIRVALDQGARLLAIDPYTGAVLRDRTEAGTWNEWLTAVHGELLSGDKGWGDLIIEIAASLGILMTVTGLYLAWPRNGNRFRSILIPDFAAKGRTFWKSIHTSIGTWMSVFLVFFLLSGLAWAGIWGGKFVQPWASFPAEKWDAVPLSDETHASMNHTALKEVPWTLELTPLPASGSQVGVQILPLGTPVVMETIVQGARALGFDGRVQITPPSGPAGVWTLSRDSMSYDSPDQMADRTVHIDQYTGKVLADIRYADYLFVGKAMAVGIALHEGQLGLWNIVANLTFCLAVIAACVTGIAMWWIRRPKGAGRIVAPPQPKDMPLFKGALLITLFLSLAFPVLGLTLLALLAFDWLILSRLSALKRLVS